MTVNPASLTITANNASKTYGQTIVFTGHEFTSTGLQNGETVGSATLSSTGAISTANVPGSPYAILISAATGGTFNPANYSISYTNGALTVNPASLTISANNASKTYGQTIVFAGTEFTSTGLQNGETLGSATLSSTGAVSTADVSGNPYTILMSAATGGTFNPLNYSINYINGILTINPATLVYTANPTSRIYGAANPVLNGTVIGFVLGQTEETATTGVLTFTTPAISTSSVGNYPVYGSGLSAIHGNYAFTQAPSNATALTIKPAAITNRELAALAGILNPYVGNIQPIITVLGENTIISIQIIRGGGLSPKAGALGLRPIAGKAPASARALALVPAPIATAAMGKIVAPQKLHMLRNYLINKSMEIPLAENTAFASYNILIRNAINAVVFMLGVVLFGLMLATWLKGALHKRYFEILLSLSKSLLIANNKNYLLRYRHQRERVALTHAVEAENLLPARLPAGYFIHDTTIAQNTNKICILSGPLSTKAVFTVTGQEWETRGSIH